MRDIILDFYNDYELSVSSDGDFIIGDSRMQNSEALLISEFYDWKIKPDNSFEPYKKINGTFTQQEIKNLEIAAQNVLKRDVFTGNDLRVQFNGSTLTIKNNNPSL